MATTASAHTWFPSPPCSSARACSACFFAFLAYDGYRVRDGLWQQQMNARGASRPGDRQVMVDETRLEQVLANFLSNAAKFAPPGEEVVVAVRAQGHGLRVSVTDRGPGIDAEFHR